MGVVKESELSTMKRDCEVNAAQVSIKVPGVTPGVSARLKLGRTEVLAKILVEPPMFPAASEGVMTMV